MNLHPRALETFASPERHTFTIINVYTGTTYTATLARETKCFYVMWVSGLVSGGRVVERRFHKATMTINELSLYIEDTAAVKAQSEKEIAAKVAYANELNATDAPTVTTDADLAIVLDSVHCTTTVDMTPDLHDAPAFCTNCETYVKHDELIFNVPTASMVCIDCDDELDTKGRELLATIKNVALLNYMGGHLGHNFTPTLKELPRMLTAFRPNTGNVGSPNEMLARIGGFMVMAARNNNTRVIYNACGEYIAHGSYDEINSALLAITNAE